MPRVRRIAKKSNKKSPMYPYKSGLEKRLHEKIFTGFQYEPKRLAYSLEANYHPDFIHEDQPKILIEAKGYMQNGHSDCKKYVAIAKSNPDYEIVFVFTNPNCTAYAQCKKRKDGTKMSLAEWCELNNFLYYSEHDVPKQLRLAQWTVEDIREVKRTKYAKTT